MTRNDSGSCRCRSLGRRSQRMNGSGPGVVHQLTGVVVMATNQPGSNAPPLQNSYVQFSPSTPVSSSVLSFSLSLFPWSGSIAPPLSILQSITLGFSAFNSLSSYWSSCTRRGQFLQRLSLFLTSLRGRVLRGTRCWKGNFLGVMGLDCVTGYREVADVRLKELRVRKFDIVDDIIPRNLTMFSDVPRSSMFDRRYLCKILEQQLSFDCDCF